MVGLSFCGRSIHEVLIGFTLGMATPVAVDTEEKHRDSDTPAKEVRIRYLPQPEMEIEDDDRAVKCLV